MVAQAGTGAYLAVGSACRFSSRDPLCTEKASMTAMGSAAWSVDRLWLRLRGEASFVSACQHLRQRWLYPTDRLHVCILTAGTSCLNAHGM